MNFLFRMRNTKPNTLHTYTQTHTHSHSHMTHSISHSMFFRIDINSYSLRLNWMKVSSFLLHSKISRFSSFRFFFSLLGSFHCSILGIAHPFTMDRPVKWFYHFNIIYLRGILVSNHSNNGWDEFLEVVTSSTCFDMLWYCYVMHTYVRYVRYGLIVILIMVYGWLSNREQRKKKKKGHKGVYDISEVILIRNK